VVAGERKIFAADNVVICAGQLPNVALADELKRKGLDATCIGGAERAEELDALRAIQQGVRLAYDL
jgi:2,4-dienoyl-CoA reductase (NADPH2)